jgi:FKBP-type peptidyl-prolyl cis-trans isomerase FkpA
MMKYILFIAALTIAVNVNAQSASQSTPKGDIYQVFTHNTGDKIKLNDVITFQCIQKTDKDSVLLSSYAAGHPYQAQVQPSQNAADLMEVFPLLTGKDSALVRVPADSIFKGHEDQRPAFLPKGSYLNVLLKIERVQSLNDAIAERNAQLDKIKAAEGTDAAKYITDHKLTLNTTPTGLKFIITTPSAKLKVRKGDTVLVNYTGKTLDDHVFDSSIEADAKGAGLQQPGRTYEPIQVIVGTGSVIPGWDEGLLLLNEGSKAKFVIPSNLAYADHGQGDIKPFSTLVFDVEVVKVKPIKHTVTTKPALKKPLHPKKKIVARKAS